MFPEINIPLPSFLKRDGSDIEKQIEECYDRVGSGDQTECDELLASNSVENAFDFVNYITSDTGILVLTGIFFVIIVVWALAHAVR